ncbi:unnamed protein product [marine sediment metagenome]|uniref:Uncharacterized protein n=1 Tax=marine sediment metagenome TaxID=412755 RepID=X1RWH0_9ZZZZ
MKLTAEECRLAFKATLELLEEKCGLKVGGKVARFEELKMAVRAPPEVVELASSNPELTREQRIKAISESQWAMGWSRGMAKLVTGEEAPEVVERLSKTLAERVV